ncbi:MAG TPA: hypothetical protein ENF37_01360 [Beggiatoa sp.]|nr:hypothetical protein [Beggiatoa sp.]
MPDETFWKELYLVGEWWATKTRYPPYKNGIIYFLDIPNTKTNYPKCRHFTPVRWVGNGGQQKPVTHPTRMG